jgi:hypothetical protein
MCPGGVLGGAAAAAPSPRELLDRAAAILGVEPGAAVGGAAAAGAPAGAGVAPGGAFERFRRASSRLAAGSRPEGGV